MATNLDPVNARLVFPCLDEPAMKATFTITVAYKDPYRAYVGGSDVSIVITNQ